MTRLLAIVVLLALASCAKRPVASRTVVTDTTIVTTVIRDTILYAPPAVAKLSINIDSIGEGQSVVSNQARLKVERRGDTLSVDCECDTVAISAALKDTWSVQRKHIREVEVIREQYIPRLIKLLAWIGAAAILLLLITIIRELS